MQTQDIVETITLKTPNELKKEEWKDTGNLNESWKTIEGYPRHQCSNTGKIRYSKENRWIESKYRKNWAGYFLVNLYDGQHPKGKTFSVHGIIALNLIPNPSQYPIINHIDGNKENNSITNLEWCSHQHNSQHAFRLGLRNDMKGENNHAAKLNFKKVNEIREKYLTGAYTYVNLSKEYNMSIISIKRIIRNRSWFDIRYDNDEYHNKVKLLHKSNIR